MLQIFSLTLFEKVPFHDLFFGEEVKPVLNYSSNRQLYLNDFMN